MVSVISFRATCRSWKGGRGTGGGGGGAGGAAALGIVSLVFFPIVMKWSLSAVAIATGSVCVFPPYVMVVGEVLFLALDGTTVCRTLACCFGSCFVLWSCCARYSFLWRLIILCSADLYRECACMLCAVGLVCARL